MTEDELVLVVDRAACFGGDWPQGFTPLGDAEARELVARFEALARFEPRVRAELEPAWKQCIPYCAVVCEAQVFCVERLPRQGETRLHGKLSIGIGGHVGREDAPTRGALARGLLRELAEELRLPASPLRTPRCVGLLNDDANAVGAVHVGLVYVLELDRPQAAELGIREISKLAGAFRPLVAPDGPWQDAARLESWSALLLDVLPRLLTEQPARRASR